MSFVEWVEALASVSAWPVVGYFVAYNSVQALLLLAALPEIWRHWEIYRGDDMDRYVADDALPPVSVIVPAYDEEQSIRETVSCLLSLRYARHEVVVVNDGSADATLALLREAYELYEIPRLEDVALPTQPVRAVYRSRKNPALIVVDKVQGGKADAINAGLCVASHPLVVAVDADTLVERDALLRLARPFILYPDVAAAGAPVRVANGCVVVNQEVKTAHVSRRWLPAMQVPEYLRSFLFGRLGWNRFGGSLIISGAFGIFRKDYVLAVGGLRSDSVGEDLDLVVRLHRYLRERRIAYRMPFVPDPIAWTEVPSDLSTLALQRERWHRGLVSTVGRNLSVLFNPRYGVMGMFSFPFLALGEMLVPLVEVFGIVLLALTWAAGVLDPAMAAAFVLAAWGYGATITLASVLVEELTYRRYASMGDLVRMLACSLMEPFGFRQLSVFWRLRGIVGGALHNRDWGRMRRTGFAEGEAR